MAMDQQVTIEKSDHFKSLLDNIKNQYLKKFTDNLNEKDIFIFEKICELECKLDLAQAQNLIVLKQSIENLITQVESVLNQTIDPSN